jgi:hypothetical protein
MTKLQDLIDLAKEPSSEKRRVLLREVTDLFFANPERRGGELTLFDDVLTQLAGEMEEAVRVELAVRLAPTQSPPFKLVRILATDRDRGRPADPGTVAGVVRRGPGRCRQQAWPGSPEGDFAPTDGLRDGLRCDRRAGR